MRTRGKEVAEAQCCGLLTLVLHLAYLGDTLVGCMRPLQCRKYMHAQVPQPSLDVEKVPELACELPSIVALTASRSDGSLLSSHNG
eukprot:2847720-Amphidinium_carterae.2